MKLRQIVYELYSHFNNNFHQIEDTISFDEKKRVTITNFLLELHKCIGLHSVGERYVYNYLLFQFNYWSEKKVEFGDRITFNRVFGKVPYERFVNRSKNFSWYNAQKHLNKYNINVGVLDSYKSKSMKNHSDLNQIEEIEKRRFKNEEIGLVNCIESTTLYNHNSGVCVTCDHQVTCKKLLKSNYPGIYTDRGYVW